MCRGYDRAERCLQIVTEHGKEAISRALDLSGVPRHGFGDRLVDRLVEPRHFFQLIRPGANLPLSPKTDHTRAERAELGDHALDAESALGPAEPVLRRGSRLGIASVFLSAVRLFCSLFFRLRCLEVMSDGVEHGSGMVAECSDVHRGRSRPLAREVLPRRQNLLAVLPDEL